MTVTPGLGTEKGSLSQGTGLIHADIVPINTLDRYFEKDEALHMDVVKIDTEGLDFLVLEGSQQLLRTQRISTLTFEYGRLARGQPFSQMISWLANLGYYFFLREEVLSIQSLPAMSKLWLT